MSNLCRKIIGITSALALIFIGASAVYSATSISANGGGAVTQITTPWGVCNNIQNNNALGLFVPANTQAEWNAFVSNAPNKVLTACCVAYSGQACSSAANSCGQTNSGTYSCEGACSAGTPANPAGYGNACTSAGNSCGQTNSGTIQCNGSCSASTPSDASCPIYGCTDSNAWNYNPSANTNDGSCHFKGCYDVYVDHYPVNTQDAMMICQTQLFSPDYSGNVTRNCVSVGDCNYWIGQEQYNVNSCLDAYSSPYYIDRIISVGSGYSCNW